MHEVTGNQERYLLAERFTEASYPIPFSYRIHGPVDAARLQAALDTVVARHDILRATIASDRHGFHAEIAPRGNIRLVHDRLDGAGEDAVRAHVIGHFDKKLAAFTPAELVKVQLVSTAADAHVLTLSLHHAIGDGVSMDVFAEEVFTAYRGDPLPPAPASFYTVMAGNVPTPQAVEANSAWWQAKLGGIDQVAGLRADLDDDRQGHGELVSTLDYASVIALAGQLDVSPFVAMLALTGVVLSRYAGSDDLQLTFQSAGRRPFPGSERVIGPFSNSVVLATRVDAAETLAALAQRQKAALAEALAHELYPYHLVVRETGVQPSFGINWFPSPYRPQVPGLDIGERDFLFYDSNYDLNIRFVRDGDTLRLLLHYKATEYSRDRIAQIAGAFADALAAATPDATVAALLPAAPPLAVPAAPPLPDARVFDAFLAQAAANPERIALIGDGRTFTYADVERASADLARRLVAAGLGIGSRVALLAERGPQLVWTMLGVLRTGATMVPLDSDYPEERLRTLVTVAKVDALLLPRPAPTPDWAASVPHVHVVADPNAKVPDGIDPAAIAAGDPGNPAYMLFTSGSTGVPKCIATSHRPVLNFLAWQRREFALTPEDRFTNLCGVAHDMMIRDVFAPLSIGARLAIPRQEDIFKPGSLLDWCMAQQPTISHLTPAMARLLAMARTGGQELPLRLMFFGGDRLTAEVVESMRELAPRAEIVNFYGATETPQAAAYHRCDPALRWRTFPIGHGIDGFALRVVDDAHEPVPDGAPGEIAVLSEHLSLGYVRDGVIQPHARPGMYFTGDTGFVLPSGEVMFTGRADDQINIRGYRIELEEVTAALASHPSVREAQVLIEGGDNPRLVGFAAGTNVDADTLYAWLNAKLPHYMVPGEIVGLPALPLLPNGKLDRKTLLAMPRPKRSRGDLRGPETELEEELVAAWGRHLSGEISPEQSFAELRGDSLAYVQVFLATEALVGNLPDDWQTMKLEELAALNRVKASWFKLVDSAMLVRAIAIVLVVAFHLKVFSAGGGATSALLMVSGFLIGKLQLREVERTKSSAPLWRLVGRVGVPSIIYTTCFWAVKAVLGKPASLSILLLYADFIDYSDRAANVASGNAFFLWYICSFLHMMILLASVTWLVLRYRPQIVDAKHYPALLFLAALPLKFVLPGLFDPYVFAHGIRPLSLFGYAPTSHLSTLLLGVCIANAATQREKLGWYAVALAYATATYFYVPSNSFMIMAFVATMLLFVRRLPIPAGIHFVILYLSGASLFIYLTHIQLAQAIEAIGVPHASVWLVPIVMSLGVAIWFAWQKVAPMARRVSPL